MDLYGTMVASWRDGALTFTVDGFSLANARTEPISKLIASHAVDIFGDTRHAALILQYDDVTRHCLPSIGFCTKRGVHPLANLIPDTFFFRSAGYRSHRERRRSGQLPSWDERLGVAFWRGSPTTNYVRPDGTAVQRLEDVPRVELCLKLRAYPHADAALAFTWGSRFPQEEALAWYHRQEIFRGPVDPADQARYKFLIDIDGVASAWGLFEKLLVGSCVLKVDSKYAQWFYDDIHPWTHFVPIKSDLSDLIEQVEWCRAHDADAREIAHNGQRLALEYGYDRGLADFIGAARRCRL